MSEKEEVVSSNSFTEEEQRFAQEAYQAYVQSQYDSCISTLKKIQKNHPGDCKLMHNRALAEFYKSGQTKIADLKKNLAKVHKVTQQSHQEDEDSVDDSASSEYSVLHFNQSVLYYNLHQYAEAQSLLEPLAESLDSNSCYINEVYLLLAEVYLTNFEPEKAGKIIAKLEEIALKPMSPNQQSKSSGEGKDKGKQKPVQNFSIVLKTALPLLKTRCSLQMKSMKACKRELKTFANLEGSSDELSIINMISVFLKSSFEFQRGNFFKAYKLLGSSPPTAALNNSRLNTGECLMTMFYNNLGVIHFHVAKYSLGTFYFMKAVEENDKAISHSLRKGDGKHQSQGSGNNMKTIQMLNMNKKFELLYNMGVQLLFSGKPSAAFDCLITAAQVFYSNPRLWLRLAECCIQVTSCDDLCEDQKKTQNTSNRAPYVGVGSGIHRKLILQSQTQHCTGNGNAVMPGVTLEFASVCLQNALVILTEAGLGGQPSKDKSKPGTRSDTTEKKTDISVPCFPSPPLSGQELNNLYASVLANSAFVALGLGDNLMAYEYSNKLLQLPHISGRHRYLGRMYAAEALVSLDRIADAIQQLTSEMVTDIGDYTNEMSKNQSQEETQSQSIQKTYSPRSIQTCFKSLSHAQGCLFLNLATAHSLRSEFEKAQKLVDQFATLVPARDVPINAILLSVYINLHIPNGFQRALRVLQHNMLLPHLGPSAAVLRSQQQGMPMNHNSNIGMKQFSAVAAGTHSSASSVELSSNGSTSGGSSGSRSKSSTPQPQYSGPPSGSVTPERIVKMTKTDNSSKTKRRR